MLEKLTKPLTKKGFELLASEYNKLWKEDRPKVVQGVADAAAEGDRSENAEYIYGKKRLREIDKRLRYLTYLLKDAQVIDPDSLRGDRVCFGSSVEVIDENGEIRLWTIVGEGEADSKDGTISWKAPVARSLLGKKVGDIVVVKLPAGEKELEIQDLYFSGRKWDAK